MIVRNKLDHRWSYIYNYTKHNTGRIWILWDETKIKVVEVSCTTQLIHCGIYSLSRVLIIWCIVIYAQSNLEQRRKLLERHRGYSQSEYAHNSSIGYSRIDKVIALYIMEPGVSDHALLCLKDQN